MRKSPMRAINKTHTMATTTIESKGVRPEEHASGVGHLIWSIEGEVQSDIEWN